MNAVRRKMLINIVSRLQEVRDDLEFIKDEEQEYMNNMPENLQGSEKYDVAEEAVSNMDDALNELDDAISSIEEAGA